MSGRGTACTASSGARQATGVSPWSSLMATKRVLNAVAARLRQLQAEMEELRREREVDRRERELECALLDLLQERSSSSSPSGASISPREVGWPIGQPAWPHPGPYVGSHGLALSSFDPVGCYPDRGFAKFGTPADETEFERVEGFVHIDDSSLVFDLEAGDVVEMDILRAQFSAVARRSCNTAHLDGNASSYLVSEFLIGFFCRHRVL